MKLFEYDRKKEGLFMIAALAIFIAGFVSMFYIEDVLTGMSVYEESPTWQYNLTNISSSSIALGDYDNDGDLDLAMAGFDGASRIAKVYQNNGTSFEEDSSYSANLIGVKDGSLSWGDIDNDGDLDLIIAGESVSGRIAKVYENNGTGLKENSSYSSELDGVDEASAALADYDNDGDIDLVLSGYRDDSPHKITKLYANDGSGLVEDNSYGANLTGVSKGSLAFGDYDNDGDMDLVVTGEDELLNGVVKLYRNNGSGLVEDNSYGANLTGAIGGSLMWADYDNDRDIDLMIGGSYTSKVYENDGAKLAENNEYSGNLTGIIYGSVIWGDYDNDGDLDLGISGYTTSFESTTKIYENNGSGLVEFDENIEEVQSSSIAFADVDKDGDLDLIVTGQDNGSFVAKVYLNNITTANSIPDAPSVLNSNWIATEMKINLSWGDGNDAETASGGLYYDLRIGTTPKGNEILSGNYSRGGKPQSGYFGNMMNIQNTRIKGLTYGTYYWSVQTIDTSQGRSNWSAEQNFTVPMCSDGIDNDNDGRVDYPADLECYGLYDVDEFGPYLIENATWQDELIDVRSGGAAFGDYDNDGDLDLAISGYDGTGEKTRVYENNGTTFTNSGMSLSGAQYSSLHWGDIDNDGDLDLALIGYRSGPYVGDIYTNVDNNLTLNSTYNYTGDFPGVFVGSVAFGDIDGDGDLDIAMSGRSNNQNYDSKIYVNNGTGFELSNEFSAGLKQLYKSSIALGDIDNDGRLDLVLAGVNSTGIKNTDVYTNNGTSLNRESGYSNILDGIAYGSINLGDYNNDSFLDLIIVGDNETYISKAFRNIGSGFAYDAAYSANLQGIRMGSSALGDFDNDGDLDLAITGENSTGNYVSKIYRNMGTTFIEFHDAQQYLEAVTHSSISWADIDDDGDLDLAITGKKNNSQFISRIYFNDMSESKENTKPSAPTEWKTMYKGNGVFNLSWGKGSDNETDPDGLTYNLAIGSSRGANDTMTWIYGGSARPTNGYFGNMLSSRNFLLSASSKKYWKVQAIDTSMGESSWSEEHWTLPTFNKSIESQTWPEDTTNTDINLSDYFYNMGDLNYTSTYPANVTVQIDNESGIAALIPDGNFTGIRHIIFTAWDAVNDSVSSNNITLNITPVNDRPHSVSLIELSEQYNTTNTTPGFDWTDSYDVDEYDALTYYLEIDDDYNFSSLYVKQNISASEHVLVMAQNLSDGIWHWRVKTCDDSFAVDNCSYSNENRTFRVDTTDPVIMIQSPQQDDIVGWNVALMADITDLVMINAWYGVINESSSTVAGGNLNETYGWDATWTTSSDNPPDGNYTFKVYANDSVGHLSMLSVNFSLDNTAPGMQIIEPSKSYYNNDFNLNIYTSSQLLARSNYSIINSTGALIQNNSNESINSSSFSWTDPVNVTGYKDGNYTLVVYSEDNVGNNRTEQVWFVVDNTNPAYYNDSASPAIIYNDGSVSLNITWIDDNVDTVHISHNASGSWQNYTATENGAVYNITIGSSLLENGEIVGWKSYCNDSTGNSNTSVINEFSVSNRAPILNSSIENISWNEDTVYYMNLTKYILDPDLDDLNYTYSVTEHVDISIDNNTAMGDITPEADWHGTAHVVFTAHDVFGASAESNNVTLTVNNVADCGDGDCEAGESSSNCPSDCGAPSSGGGGGGGIGRDKEHKIRSYYNLVPNKEYIMDVDGEEYIVTRIFFMVNKELKDVSFDVIIPDDIDVPGLDDVYKYFEIMKANIENKDLEYLRIEFAVRRGWADENNYDSIDLMKYNDEWRKMNIKYSWNSDDHDYYIAYLDGFSTFAVVGYKDEIEEAIVDEEAEEVVGGATGEKEEEAEEIFEELRIPAKPYKQYIIATVVMMAVVIILLITTIAIEGRRAGARDGVREIRTEERKTDFRTEIKENRKKGIKERKKLIKYREKVGKNHKKMYEMLKMGKDKKARKYYDKALVYYEKARKAKEQTMIHFDRVREGMKKKEK